MIGRLSDNSIDYKGLLAKNKPRIPRLEGLEERLEYFHDLHHLNIGIRLLYNDDAIVVIADHPERWTENLHESLCEMFPVILYAVEKDTVIRARNVKTTVIYQYLNKFLNDKWNEVNEVKWNQIMVVME